MSRKLFAAGLFALACTITLYAHTVATGEETLTPGSVSDSEGDKGDKGDKKGEGKGGPGGKFGKGGFDKSKIDPEKLKAMKEKFGKGGFDKSKIDPEKLKELKEKFGKGGKGGFGKGKKDKGNENNEE
ncbi:hypothetical protein VT84_34645 [Gemmata sp. SH-PL17]|uniref:hypothetical protein n=1 Tax=Gemmata sp. SH-PL17 TaxID=1630693 RepID=UPI00078EEB5D|nr:hypothetical protein [Gemmata sp. SH-PL17]AMV29585.1 hypothetical protein VT84_34645 [Gemmata sp. SH-PL17]